MALVWLNITLVVTITVNCVVFFKVYPSDIRMIIVSQQKQYFQKKRTIYLPKYNFKKNWTPEGLVCYMTSRPWIYVNVKEAQHVFARICAKFRDNCHVPTPWSANKVHKSKLFPGSQSMGPHMIPRQGYNTNTFTQVFVQKKEIDCTILKVYRNHWL